MTSMRKLLAAVLVAAALAAGARPAQACSCVDVGPPCQGAWSVDAVFIATIASIETRETPVDSVSWEMRRVRLRVSRVFRGDVQPGPAEVLTGAGGGDCGYEFAVGGTYVVYAHRQRGLLTTNICTLTKPLAQASRDLAYLESLGAMAHDEAPRVTVKVVLVDDGPHPTRQPASGVRVVLAGDQATAESMTGEDGEVTFNGLPPGTYEVTAEPLPPLAAFGPTTISLPDRQSCAEMQLGVSYDGRIRGSIVGPDGQPLQKVRPSLRAYQPGEDDREYGGWHETDAAGRFEIERLSPGEYVLAIGLDRHLSGDDTAYPETWYPGVPRREDAQVIGIGPGEHVQLRAFTAPHRLKRVTVRGRVTWPAGIAWTNVTVLVWDGDTGTPVGEGTGVASDGVFERQLYEGRRYVFEASAMLPGRRQALMGRSHPISVSSGMGEIVVDVLP